MNEIARLVDLLGRVHDGDPWHGSSTREILSGISAGQAAHRPIPQAHTIWEIVLHMAAWKNEVRERLRGRAPQLPDEGDWPSASGVDGVSEAAWRGAQAALQSAHESLVAAVRAFPEHRLNEAVGGGRDAEVGAGVAFAMMLHGIIHHDVYHGGQIALLKKAPEGISR